MLRGSANPEEVLISSVKSTLLNEIETQLLEVWLRHKSEEIKEAVQLKINAKNHEYKKSYDKELVEYNAAYKSVEELNKSDNASYEKKNSEYVSYQKALSKGEARNLTPVARPLKPTPRAMPIQPTQLTVDQFEINGFTATVKNSFTQTFNSLWATQFKSCFNVAFDDLVPSIIIKKFFDRHPWLSENAFQPQYFIVRQFLEWFLRNQLLIQFIPSIGSWNNLPVECFQNNELFKWNSTKKSIAFDKMMQDQIEGYPLSNVNGFYVTHKYKEYPNIVNMSSINQPLSRIDIFRWLHTNYKDRLGITRINNVICASIAPFDEHDLSRLSPQQWDHLQTMILNINTQNEPLWVCVKKVGNQWTAYIPEWGESSIRKFIHYFPNGLSIETVDYQNNLALNNVNLDPNTAWNGVLFGRVLPALSLNKNVANYRSHVPLPILVQSMMEDCVCGFIEINKGFTYRSPLSDKNVHELIPHCGEYKPLFELKSSDSKSILDAFDSNQFTITSENRENKQCDTLTVIPPNSQKNLSFIRLQEAMTTIFYHNNFTRLRYSPIESRFSFENNTQACDLFNFNARLLSVSPQIQSKNDLTQYAHPMQCAARNRFLKNSTNFNYLGLAENNMDARRNLWLNHGSEVFHFFTDKRHLLNQDFIKSALEFKKKWRESHCEHSMERETSPEIWRFLQIAETGKQGLDVLFKYLDKQYSKVWNEVTSSPAPNMPALFDLSGDLCSKSEDYIHCLTAHINAFHQSCHPLFSSLSVIMPEPLGDNTINKFTELLTALTIRWRKNQDEVGEIYLHNLDLRKPECEALLRKLEKLANENDLQTVIRVPEWDRMAPLIPGGAIKARYRALQNKILDNQRKYREQQLKNNLSSLQNCETSMAAEVKLSGKQRAQEEPPLEDELDFTFTLESKQSTPGIQQQLQEEVKQDVEIKHEQFVQVGHAQEQQQQVIAYSRNESILITRENIDSDDFCHTLWKAVSQKNKDLSGWDQTSLRQLFSLWVGSDKNADQVIEKMEPDAIAELMKYPSQHRMGLSKDNLPPGFYLAYSEKSSQRTLILCFNQVRKAEELRKLKHEKKKKLDPFQVITHDPKTAVELNGDYRQFAPLSKKPEEQETLWRFLAHDGSDRACIDNARQALATISPLQDLANDEVSVMMQRYNATSEVQRPSTLEDCLCILQKWAEMLPWANENKESGGMRHAFFQDPTLRLSQANLKSLGQLFNHYESQEAKTHAMDGFLQMADKIYRQFGANALKVWKERFLDPSNNWTELLDQEEVDALALSIATLKGQKHLQNLWWKLVDIHGAQVGNIRYSQLWYAFERFVVYMDEHNLSLNEREWSCFLDKAKNFNGNVFLDRLVRVLKRIETEFEGNKNQQIILNNLIHIDWSHSGFYYANQYENFPYWNEVLQLIGLKPTLIESKEHGPTYCAKWPNALPLLDSKLHALRFATLRMSFTNDEINHFSHIINELPDNINSNVIRLFTACLDQGLGVDKISDFVRPLEGSYTEDGFPINSALLVNWMNSQFDLDAQLKPRSIQLRFSDLTIFANALQAENLYNLDDMNHLGIDWVNSCGRALQCIKGDDRQTQFDVLLKFANNKELNHPLLTTYPWIHDKYDENADPHAEAKKILPNSPLGSLLQEQLAILETQLRSIDFNKSTFLPDQKMLRDAYLAIASAQSKDEAIKYRREAVSSWIKSRCAILNQDAPFRHLSDEEDKHALHYLESRLRLNYRSVNILLFKTFINEKMLAIDTPPNHPNTKPQLEKLFGLLANLDNKSHYNELSQVLGLLISTARNDNAQARSYSLPQLIAWLEALQYDPAAYQKYHYPVDLLREVIEFNVLDPNSTFLNTDLNRLKSYVYDEPVKQQIRSIVRSDISNFYKANLVKLALRNNRDLNYVQNCLKRLNDLTQLKLPHQWLSSLGKLFLVLEHHPDRENLLNECSIRDNRYSDRLKELWQKSQIKRMDLIEQGYIYRSANINSDKEKYIQIILMMSLHSKTLNEEQKKLLTDVRAQLNTWDDVPQLQKLAEYYAEDAGLTLQVLNRLLPSCKRADLVISQFEAVEQGLDRQCDLLVSSSEDFMASSFGGNKTSFVLVQPIAGHPPTALYFVDRAGETPVVTPVSFRSNQSMESFTKTFYPGINDHHYKDLIDLTSSQINQAATITGCTPLPKEKRQYSLSPQDKEGLKRVLEGMKRKGEESTIPVAEQTALLNYLNYLNNFSIGADLHEKSFNDLHELLERSRLDLLHNKNPKESIYASMRLLACMREILLRKAGKWANHTQMLDLIYSAVYNEDNLLHQIRTGQGKSIISIMRNCYLALTGYVIDLYSAKDALSSRDHEEFLAVLNGMGIPHAYIKANSPIEAYHDEVSGTSMGAINFATIGNWSLSQSAPIWHRNSKVSKINNPKVKRAAYLDECDFLLKFEQTQFNYSDNQDGYKIYNLDEWVYQIASEYYLELRKESASKPGEKIILSRNVHLEELRKRIQSNTRLMPRDSSFFRKYILPALNKDDRKARRKLDKVLRQLLMAAQSAEEMKESIDFSVRSDMKQVSGGLIIPIRVARVIIDAQEREGSTYSDWVHQFLHIRLNREAAARGETPNFFVEPTSQIVLSQNAEYILSNYYDKIEGCSSTAGSVEDLAVYNEKLGITHLIKIPTHEEYRMEYLEPIYADNEEAQIKAIADDIVQYSDDMNILETCSDDLAVKDLAPKVKNELSRRIQFQESKMSSKVDLNLFHIDTNDSGKKESEMLGPAAEIGANLFSARMGRGTDIKPKSKKGMHVLRTYAAISPVRKQEIGRGARNAMPGKCREIINYGAILNEYQSYSDEKSPHCERLNQILEKERRALNKKIEKDRLLRAQGKPRRGLWIYFDETVGGSRASELKEKHLITRATVQLRYEIKRKNQLYIRRKELLIARLDGQVMRELQKHIDRREMTKEVENFQAAWFKRRQKIESLWKSRLENKIEGDTEEVYAQFLKESQKIWDKMVEIGRPQFNLNPDMSSYQKRSINGRAHKVIKRKQKHDEMAPLERSISLHQGWIKGSKQAYFDEEKPTKAIIDAIYGVNVSELSEFYRVLKKISTKGPAILFQNISDLIKNNPNAIYSLNVYGLALALKKLREQPDSQNKQDCLYLNTFFDLPLFRKKPLSHQPDDIRKNSLLLNVIVNIFTKCRLDSNTTIKAITDLSMIIYDHFWKKLDVALANEITLIFSDAKIVSLLLGGTNYFDLYFIINLIEQNLRANGTDTRALLIDYLKSKTFQKKTDIDEEKSASKTCAEQMTQQPHLIRPLFELAFAGKPFGFSSYLPPIEILSIFEDPIIQSEFCYFLTRRMPVMEKDFHLFKNHFWQPEKTRLLQSIFALPPLLDLEFINEELHSLFDEKYSEDKISDAAQEKLSQLMALGTAFNDYLKAAEIISGHLPVSVSAKDKLNNWLQFLKKYSKQSNNLQNTIDFFITAKKYAAGMSPEILEKIALNLLHDTIQLDQLEKILQFANKLQGYSDTKRLYVEAKLFEILNANQSERNELVSKSQQIDELEQFAKHVDASSSTYSNNELDCLFQVFRSSEEKEVALLNCIKVISKLHEFTKIHEFDLLSIYLRDGHSDQANLYYLEFVEELLQPKNYIFSQSVIKSLYKAYFVNMTIVNMEQLSTVCDLIHEALDLQEGRTSYSDYFGDLGSMSARRQRLMQYLHHDLLSGLDKEFIDRCNTEYNELIIRMTQEPQGPTKKKEEQHSKDWRTYHQALVRFVGELSVIAEPPYQNREQGEQKDLEMKSNLSDLGERKGQAVQELDHDKAFKSLFAMNAEYYVAQRQRYSSLSKKIQLRVDQARHLFDKLDQLHRIQWTDVDTYYLAQLSAIKESQEEILENDKDTKNNKKGYSRLLDLTREMFVTVATQLITDPKTSDRTKLDLNKMLQEQFQYSMFLLCERLSLHPLASEIEKLKCDGLWVLGSSNLSNLNNLFRIHYKTVPAHLHYLLEHINSFVSSSNNREVSLNEELSAVFEFLEYEEKSEEKKESLERPQMIIPPSIDEEKEFQITPEILGRVPKQLQSSFTDFINQRRPINIKVFQMFSAQFLERAHAENDQLYNEQVLKPLFKLTPFLDLSCIQSQLQFNPGRTYWMDVQEKIEELKKAGDSFIDYLREAGILAGEPLSATSPEALKVLSLWQEYWKSPLDLSSLAGSESFFKLAKQYPGVPSDIMFLLAGHLSKGVLRYEYLDKVLIFADNLKTFPTRTHRFLRATILTILQRPSVNQPMIDVLEQFTQRLRKAKTDFSERELDHLHGVWLGSNNNLEILEKEMEVIAKIHEFERRWPGLGLLDSFLKIEYNSEFDVHCTIYLVFMNELLQPENRSLNQAMIKPLYETYFSHDNKQMACAGLKTACAVIREALTLQKIPNHYNHYFNNFATQREQRQRLMQYLHHGLLAGFGQEFYETCNEKYQELADQLTKADPNVTPKKYSERAQQWRNRHKAVVMVTEELRNIANNPYLSHDRAAEEYKNNSHVTSTDHFSAFFSEQRRQYKGVWIWLSSNKLRRAQANALFTDLESVQKIAGQSPATFYLANLRAIIKAQNDILNRDKSTKYNSKGHSRLLDITVKMFVTVASDFLTDLSISPHDKMQLREMLQKQLRLNISILIDRLGEEHKLAKALSQLSVHQGAYKEFSISSTEMNGLRQLLQKTCRDDVPKHLHYLLDHLDSFVGLGSDFGKDLAAPKTKS